VYTFAQIDDLLSLAPSTSRRWIDGYSRQGKTYAPVIRARATGSEVATWGEFVECRFLAEYRDAGVRLIRLRPVVERLRAELGTPYPLASSRLRIEPQGRDLVARVQRDLSDELEPSLMLVRTGEHQARRPDSRTDHRHGAGLPAGVAAAEVAHGRGAQRRRPCPPGCMRGRGGRAGPMCRRRRPRALLPLHRIPARRRRHPGG
jgi:hypothetical protein